MHLLWAPPSQAGGNVPSQATGEETLPPSTSSIAQTPDTEVSKEEELFKQLEVPRCGFTPTPVITPTSANISLKEPLSPPYPSPGLLTDTLAVIP